MSVLGEAFRRTVEQSRKAASSADTVRSRPPLREAPQANPAEPPAIQPSSRAEFMRHVRRTATFAEGPLAPGCDVLAALRAALEQTLGARTGPATILITGPEGSCGMTAIAAGLAGELARDLLHCVLLVDANIRRPGIAALLQVDTELDLSDVLEARASLEEAIVYSEGDNLSVLALRTASRLSAESFAGSPARELFSRLEKLFDYIVIDAGDMASSAVPQVLAGRTTGAVVVLGYGVSRERSRECISAIRNAGGKVLGAILTGTPRR